MKTSVADNPMGALQQALGDRYTLYGELGRGGMGIVYMAHEPRLDRYVALKLLPPTAAAPWRERFIREARIAAQLAHPHIVPIYAVDDAGDFVFYTMAFVEGETLGERIREKGALTAGEVTRILYDVAGAVGYAHQQGVVHRDLKPDNILLEEGTDRALVLDFGLAQRQEHADDDRDYLRGTLAFLSPERVLGRPADVRSDIYALGITAYTAAAGELPFKPTKPEEIVEAHLRLAVPRLEARGQDGNATLAMVVARCLAEDPKDRFQTAAGLVQALKDAPEIRGDTPVPLRAFVDRSRALARSASDILLLMGLAVYWLVGSVAAGDGSGVLIGVGALALLAGIPAVRMLAAVRRVLRAGFDHDAIVAALRADTEHRREELAYDLGGDPTTRGRWGRRIAWGALGVMALAAGWMVSGLPGGLYAVFALFASVPVAVIAGLVGHARARRPRQTLAGNVLLRFWQGPVGAWVAGLAGLGINPAGADDGPDGLLQVHGVVELMDSHIDLLKAELRAGAQAHGLNVEAMESLRSRIAGATEGGSASGTLTDDIAAARRVCEMVELMMGARLVAKDLRAE